MNVRIKIPRVPSDLGDDLVEFLVELLEVPSLILTFLGVLFHYCDLQGTRVKETSYSPMVPLCSELEFRQFSYLYFTGFRTNSKGPFNNLKAG